MDRHQAAPVRFQWPIVAGSQPRVVALGSDPSLLIGPIMASGAGSVAPRKGARRQPIFASNCALLDNASERLVVGPFVQAEL